MGLSEYSKERIVKDLQDFIEKVGKEFEELRAAANPVGQIQQYVKVPWVTSEKLRGIPKDSQNRPTEYSYYAHKHNNVYRNPEQAKEELKKLWEESLPFVKQNIEINNHNNAVCNYLIKICEEAGLAKQKWVMGTGRKKSGWKDTGWKTEISGSRPALPAGWFKSEEDFAADLNRKLQDINKWEEVLKEKERTRARAAADAEAKRKSDIVIASLYTKYNVDSAEEPDAILDSILDKNKYLRLAYYLEKNRNDWSEGCNYAEIGLARFTAETAEDKEIEEAIGALCDDWGGDGRCFRDCEYNYSYLYDKVSKTEPELVEDLEKVQELLSQY